MTASALARRRGLTRPEVAEGSANDMRDACERLEKLYRGLSAPGVLDGEMKRDQLPEPSPSMEAINAAASRLVRRTGIETLMYSCLKAGNDVARPGLLPLRHWQFLAEEAGRVVIAAERAFALDLPEASAQLFAHAMDVLARIALEVEGDSPPPKPSSAPLQQGFQH